LNPNGQARGIAIRVATIGGVLGLVRTRGLASIVFVLILLEETVLPERPLMLTVVTWTVALSVYAHGLTAGPAANRYADWYHARHEHHRVMPESVPVAEQRPRGPHSTSSEKPGHHAARFWSEGP
jgi:hypothetical protein